MGNHSLEDLFRQFDMHYSRIRNIIREIEYAERKREIALELDMILDKYNIKWSEDDGDSRD